MKLNDIVNEVHTLAVDKGWYETERTALEYHMLVVSEVAEATEAVRSGEMAFWLDDATSKPEGEAVELADAFIRIADYFGYKGWDMEEIVRTKIAFNRTRSHRHGGKKL
jgi:NTP pyrophosphatase (non-canonical NTP hydrolase)